MLYQVLAATAVTASAINIGGGFTITQRMLDMFRRPGDPEEHNQLYAIPGAALLAGSAAGYALGERALSTTPDIDDVNLDLLQEAILVRELPREYHNWPLCLQVRLPSSCLS